MSCLQLAHVKGCFIPETPVQGSLRKNVLHTLGLSSCHTALQVIFEVLCALSSHGQKGYRMPPWYFSDNRVLYMTNFQKTCRLSRPRFSAVACYMEKQSTRISSCVFFHAHGRRGHTNPEFRKGNQRDRSACKKNQGGWGFLDEALPKKTPLL